MVPFRRWSHTLAFTVYGLFTCALCAERGQITLEEARSLVYEIVKANNPGAEVAKVGNRYDGEFLYFEVIVDNPVASPVIGHFAVNLWNADVWNWMGCRRVTSPSLLKLQATIRKRLGLSEKDTIALATKTPLCEASPEQPEQSEKSRSKKQDTKRRR